MMQVYNNNNSIFIYFKMDNNNRLFSINDDGGASPHGGYNNSEDEFSDHLDDEANGSYDTCDDFNLHGEGTGDDENSCLRTPNNN